jgi:hypothetical protein
MPARRGLAAALVILLAACGGEEGEVLVEDNFEPAARDWSIEDTADTTYEYADGGYRIVAKQPGDIVYSLLPSDPSFTALTVEADMTLLTGSGGPDAWGVACLSGSRLGYLFTVVADGRYTVGKAIDLSNAEVDLIEAGESDVIHGLDETNRVRGDCSGGENGPTRLTLSVNGERITEVEDPEGLDSFDVVGFVIYTRNGGTEVLVDNLLVTEG